MSDMLPGLFDEELGITQPEQSLFDYEQVPVDRRGFVLQKTAETQWLLKRTAEDIINIGKNLLEVKAVLPHGLFLPWIKAEFELSYDSANDFMNVAKRLEGKIGPGPNLGMKVLRELASPSTPSTYIDQVASGQRSPSLEDIKQAQLEARLAKEAAKRAQADALAAQRQLFNVKDAAQTEIDALTKQLEAKKQEIETLTTPEVIIQEVPKEVLPQSVQNQLEEYQKEINKLKTTLENEKQNIPPETQKKLDDLQRLVDRLKQQEVINKQQQERIDKLTEELQSAVRKGVASENDERIRQNWRQINSEARSCLMRLLAQWPSPIDVQSFEADDWARVDQLKQTLRRVMDECDSLRFSGDEMVVDEHMSRSPVRVIDAG